MDQQPKKRAKKRRLTQRMIAQAVELRAKCIPNDQIALAIDATEQAVSEALSHFKDVFKTLEEIPRYKQVRSDIISACELTALKSVASGPDTEATYLEKVKASEILHKMGRLERNLSTSNMATTSVWRKPGSKD